MFHRNICDFAQICIKLQKKYDEIGQNAIKTCTTQKKVVTLQPLSAKAGLLPDLKREIVLKSAQAQSGIFL
jgi:hypothetical protein